MNALGSDEQLLADFLRQAMRQLGFSRYIEMGTEEGRALLLTFSHGIRKTCPELSYMQAMEIILDMATSGESFGWPDKMTRGFFAALRAKFHKPTGVAAISPVPQLAENCNCEVCYGEGIAILPQEHGGGSAACVCGKGRYLFSAWCKTMPKVLDLNVHTHIVESILREKQGVAIPVEAESPAELLRYYKDRVVNGHKVQPGQPGERRNAG